MASNDIRNLNNLSDGAPYTEDSNIAIPKGANQKHILKGTIFVKAQ